MGYAIMRCKKHKMGGGLNVALQHLYRERDTPNADKSVQNMAWTQDGEQSTKGALERLHSELARVHSSSGRKLRRDAVVAIEYVMTASPEMFSDDPTLNRKQGIELSKRARLWLEQEFPDCKIIAAQVHFDETTPHLSAFVVPVHKIGDRLSLSARAFVGSKSLLAKQQDSFSEAMKPLGLKRGMRGSRARHEAVNRFYGRLKAFEGQKSELVEKYRAEIDKIDSKMFGGKAELVELAKLMADDLATLQSNYKRTVAEVTLSAEEARSKRAAVAYEAEIHELQRHLKEANNALKMASEELAFTKRKNTLYNDGLAAVDEWVGTLRGEEAAIINRHADVMNYEIGTRMYKAGISKELPQDPYKQASPKGPNRA